MNVVRAFSALVLEDLERPARVLGLGLRLSGLLLLGGLLLGGFFFPVARPWLRAPAPLVLVSCARAAVGQPTIPASTRDSHTHEHPRRIVGASDWIIVANLLANPPPGPRSGPTGYMLRGRNVGWMVTPGSLAAREPRPLAQEDTGTIPARRATKHRGGPTAGQTSLDRNRPEAGRRAATDVRTHLSWVPILPSRETKLRLPCSLSPVKSPSLPGWSPAAQSDPRPIVSGTSPHDLLHSIGIPIPPSLDVLRALLVPRHETEAIRAVEPVAISEPRCPVPSHHSFEAGYDDRGDEFGGSTVEERPDAASSGAGLWSWFLRWSFRVGSPWFAAMSPRARPRSRWRRCRASTNSWSSHFVSTSSPPPTCRRSTPP